MKTIQEHLSGFFDLFVPRIDPDNPEIEPSLRSWKSMIVPIVITLSIMVIIILI